MVYLSNLLRVGALLFNSAIVIQVSFTITKSELVNFRKENISDEERHETTNFKSAVNLSDVDQTIGAFSLVNETIRHLCPHRDSCQVVNHYKFAERTCECDSLCPLFGDCCLDANVEPKIQHLRSWGKNTCMAYGIFQEKAMYVVATCPRNYDDTKIKKFCEGDDDFSDPLLSVPVTDMFRGRSYRNRYCALCNGHLTSDLKSWFILSIFLKSVPRVLDKRYIYENIIFNPDLKKWGLHVDGEFYDSELRFVKPSYIPILKECRPNVISSCPPTYKIEWNIQACELYTSVIYSGGRLYKNVHCAICNGRRDVSCMPPHQITKRNASGITFPLLLDFNWLNGNYVGFNSKCDIHSMYDPFSVKCRNIVCVFDDYELINGKCYKKRL